MMNNFNLEKRKQILDYFRSVAVQEIQKLSGPKQLSDLFTEEDREKTILLGCPKSYGDLYLISSLLKGVQETYPDKRIYITCEPQYFPIFEGNEYVKRLIPWNPAFDNIFLFEGVGENKNLVWMYFPLHGSTQRFVDYTHSGKDITKLELNY